MTHQSWSGRISDLPRIELARFCPDEHAGEKFALLGYNGTINLGDEIQSLAARQFLPRVDAFVDRDALGTLDLVRRHKIILNGWYSHRPEHWPPTPSLSPLLVSMHASHTIWEERNVNRIAFADRVLEPDSLAYLAAHGPVGLRDTHSRDLLAGHGVDTYFSGCMTLTLTAQTPLPRPGFACVNDLDDAVADFVADQSGLPVLRTGHLNRHCTDPEKRMAIARNLLSIYASASMVVTSRLHCALPSLAFGTPVLFCPTATDVYRFSGLIDLLRHATREALLEGAVDFDFRRPSSNGTAHVPLREALMARCLAFIG